MSDENEITTAIVSSEELKFLAGYAIGEVHLESLSDGESPGRFVVVQLKRYTAPGSEDTEEFEVLMTALQADLIQQMLAQSAVRVHERSKIDGASGTL